jgi:nucleoid-associated protein YgaU
MENERLNETRWVTVLRGDTLYDIADRVYDDGWLYHKLFEANPQVLSNPDLIKPGQRLRVPL